MLETEAANSASSLSVHTAAFVAEAGPPDPGELEREIATRSAHLDAATHRLLTCIRWFDEAEFGAARAHFLVRIGFRGGSA